MFDILFVLEHNIDKSNIRHKIKQLLKPLYFLKNVFLFLVITASKEYINAAFFSY